VEIGGNWVEGVGGKNINPVLSLVQKRKLNFVPTDFDNCTYRMNNGVTNQDAFDARSAVFDKVTEALDDMYSKQSGKNVLDISLRAAYRLLGWHPQDALDNVLEWNSFDWEQAETPDVSSFRKTSDQATFTNFGEESNMVLDKRGFQYIVEAEAADFGCGYGSSCLKLGKVVTQIKWASAPVTVTCKDGSVYTADFVVSSVSLGVLQHGDIKFTPSLPDWKLQAIQSHHIATYTKIFIAFPSKFWTEESQFLYYGNERRGEFISWQIMTSAPFNSYFKYDNVLLCTVTDEVARRLERQSDEDTKAEMVQVLRKMYGSKVPNASAILVPRWTSDPLFRGSFTNWPIGFTQEQFQNLIAPVNRLWFTGEHTSAEYFGYIHGAIIAGNRTGNDLVKCIKSSCPKYPYYPTLANNVQDNVKYGQGQK
ncbi:hypothetical protein BCR33DRAFT_661302, partial [Rhizoclosmatium globosum]